MSPTAQATGVWILLITLSAIAAWIGEFGTADARIVAFLLVALVIKGQLVVDQYMGLKHVSWLWRGIMSAFCVVIGLITFLTYQLQ